MFINGDGVSRVKGTLSLRNLIVSLVLTGPGWCLGATNSIGDSYIVNAVRVCSSTATKAVLGGIREIIGVVSAIGDMMEVSFSAMDERLIFDQR